MSVGSGGMDLSEEKGLGSYIPCLQVDAGRSMWSVQYSRFLLQVKGGLSGARDASSRT